MKVFRHNQNGSQSQEEFVQITNHKLAQFTTTTEEKKKSVSLSGLKSFLKISFKVR